MDGFVRFLIGWAIVCWALSGIGVLLTAYYDPEAINLAVGAAIAALITSLILAVFFGAQLRDRIRNGRQ